MRRVTWPSAIAGFALVIWLVPARGYRLPISLPFNLEPYRIVLAALIIFLLLAVHRGRARLEFLGFGGPLALLAGTATVAALMNYEALGSIPGDAGALKSLSYYLGFLAVFVVVASTIKTHAGMDTVARGLVDRRDDRRRLGALRIARRLQRVRPSRRMGSRPHSRVPADFTARGGNLRVYASAQHPSPSRPRSSWRSRSASTWSTARGHAYARILWGIVAAALRDGRGGDDLTDDGGHGRRDPGRRLWLRASQVLRFWPVLLILPIAIHFAVPGALGGIYGRSPASGLASDLTTRAGESGSGRLADIDPGLRVWSESPLYGNGIGTEVLTGEAGAAQTAVGAEGAVIYFDNEWLTTLVALGVLGIVGTAWFVFGSLLTVGRFASRVRGPRSDLAAACAASIGAFAFSMLVFDAFAFVKSTVVFFMIAALGLQARRLGPRPTDS